MMVFDAIGVESSLLLSGEFLVLLFRDKRTNNRCCLCDTYSLLIASIPRVFAVGLPRLVSGQKKGVPQYAFCQIYFRQIFS